MIRVGINGFGRIGRRLLRLSLSRKDIQITHINDLAPLNVLAHLFKYDSIHGSFRESVETKSDKLIVAGQSIHFSQHPDPTAIHWPIIDVVIDCTGKHKTAERLQPYRDNGIPKVILSAPPADDSMKTIVLGINDSIIEQDDSIISCASCTTNNAAPMIQVMQDLCGVEQAYITTVHSYTTDQGLHDHPHNDLRRARAAGQSIVPTTTGAAKALTKVFPDLSDVIGGCGIRVPVPNGSLTDMTINVARDTSIKEVNEAFLAFAKANPDIFHYTEVPIVSVDILGSTHSCTLDAQMTSVIGRMVKLIGWYDNETGYASRLLDLTSLIATK